MRKKILLIYTGLAVAALLYLLLYLITGSGIPCFYLTRYGYTCPGCGLSRMLFSILKLDFSAAFLYNPVGFMAFFLWNGIAAIAFCDKVPSLTKPRTLYILLALTVAAFLIQGFIRNAS